MENSQLNWRLVPWTGADGYPKVWKAKVGRGSLTILTWNTDRGVSYVSSFGASSDDSFSGFLPGSTVEQAKLSVLDSARKLWNGLHNPKH